MRALDCQILEMLITKIHELIRLNLTNHQLNYLHYCHFRFLKLFQQFSKMNEYHLWKKFKEGDKEAFSEIYYDNYNALYNYLNKIGGNISLTEDCIQDLFLNLWRTRKKLAAVQSIKSYLLASARRDLIKKIQKNRKIEHHSKEIFLEEPNLSFSEEEIVINLETSNEEKNKITKALNSLPKRQKEAIYLKYYEGLSYEEVADLMGVNYQSVINLIYKAFKALRNNNLLKIISRLHIVLAMAPFFH